ncbi:PIN domain-containing protein [Streptomyces sp. ISL-36]|uniref:PIN domain-containing protein n=1 Tax=Streptomyces sp. ISL-36 TaxID=2819182 RepID=UPI001BEBCB2D|nr:PIN domain-containing protein [Streptomyces sp. ISL-36]MBT2440894.1 PIN domain-containing protein [Streptomyces sp. ISL-36]
MKSSLRVETLVLDSEGLSAWIAAKDPKTTALLKAFDAIGAEFVVCANTIVEVMHAKVNLPRLDWLLARTKVEPVTEQSARAAAKLLKATGLHGHKYAIDATVAEMAMRQPGPVVMLTPDVDDMARLCGDKVRLMPL